MSEITRKKFEEKKPKLDKKKGWEQFETKGWGAVETEMEEEVEKARRKEQKIKAELKEEELKVKEEQERIVRQLINELDSRRGDEARDASNYFNLAQKYSNIPHAAKIFQQLSEDEDSHAKRLRVIADELERQLRVARQLLKQRK